MPIFEYECRQCRQGFELLVRGGTVAECPGCGGRDLAKQLSVFAVGRTSGGGGRSAPEPAAPCGTCGDPRGPGSCARD
jgi:putative FmdB family regulatory protein